MDRSALRVTVSMSVALSLAGAGSAMGEDDTAAVFDTVAGT